MEEIKVNRWKARYRRIKTLVDIKLMLDTELLKYPKGNLEKIEAVYKAIDEVLKDEISGL